MSEEVLHCPQCDVPFLPPPGHASGVACPFCGVSVPAKVAKPGDGEWYLAREKKKFGPASSAQIKKLIAAGKLVATDMLQRSGAKKWTAAGDFVEFFPRSIMPPTALAESIPLTYTPDQTAFGSRHDILAQAQVVPEAANCVQCGMCSYNCPMEIDVRAHAWRGKPIRDSHCLTCSECVNRCPRGVLRFERIPLFTVK